MNTVKITVQTTLEWRASRSGTSERWIGVCDAMNLATEAESLDELHSVISETMHAVMLDLLLDNELERFLRERGWKAVDMPRDVRRTGDVRFDVPWQLIAAGATHDSPRRAQ